MLAANQQNNIKSQISPNCQVKYPQQKEKYVKSCKSSIILFLENDIEMGNQPWGNSGSQDFHNSTVTFHYQSDMP